jgi:hypothetical protein
VLSLPHLALGITQTVASTLLQDLVVRQSSLVDVGVPEKRVAGQRTAWTDKSMSLHFKSDSVALPCWKSTGTKPLSVPVNPSNGRIEHWIWSLCPLDTQEQPRTDVVVPEDFADRLVTSLSDALPYETAARP